MFKRKIGALTLFVLIYLYNQNSFAQESLERIPLIPLPVSLQTGNGMFEIKPSTILNYNDDKIASDVEIFSNYINSKYGFNIKTSKSSNKKDQQINVFFSAAKDSDSYHLSIDSSGIFIEAGKNSGAFYALQTLIQLLPAGYTKDLSVTYIKIDDAPRFSYRGMHLDVSRHFFSASVVKNYIDHLAMYKMNVFHWHLTDDQGWRIEIKSFPKLQSISAWRNNTLNGHLGDKPEVFDTLKHGGYYTQEEIKDIVNYATKRHITIIPEIEMPGHALAALAAYPEYSCTGGPFEVGKTWGVFKDVFCPKEETFQFLQKILDEVCDLFPGKYIHIGGDECPKDRWKNCTHCQELIKKENLKNENDLQRYFTNRIASYLKVKNKTAIGWDEILEEGLDSDAVIMSWRGYNGGAKAAANGHDAVMTPSDFCYFNMYQSRFTGGRIAIGGYLPVEMVYRFEPVPDVLNPEQAKHIIGAQGNLWTEYISEEDHLQEMIFPRISALAEVLWSPAVKRDFNNFSSRLVSHFKLLKFLKLKYSTALFDITSKVTPNGRNGLFIEMFTNYSNSKIYYTTNGTVPTLGSLLYNEKIPVDQSVGIKAVLFEGVQQRGSVFSQIININKATGKEIILADPPHEEYRRGGGFSLVNGTTGNLPWIPSEWLGFLGKDLDATIDLGMIQTITRVTVDVLKDEEGKIFLPKEVIILTSENGKDYTVAGTINSVEIEKMNRKLKLQFKQIPARWVKVIAKNSNGKNWLFVDEIMVD